MAVSRQNVYKKSSKVYTGNVTLRLRPCDQLCQAFLFVYFLYKRARKQSLSSVIKSICLETTELHRFFFTPGHQWSTTRRAWLWSFY